MTKRLQHLLFALSFAASPPVAAEPASSPAGAGEVAKAAVRAFDKLFGGPHAGHRAVHAKGVLTEGDFIPSEAAGSLSRADHFQASVPVVVRFSDFAGIPAVADGAGVASPRGMAIKFMLRDGGETDIVAHSYDGFPVATGEAFVGFLRGLADPDPAVLRTFLASHPAAQTFLDAPKPAPASYATERFFGVNAFRFTNMAGASRFGRYRLEPVAGAAHLTAEQAAGRSPDYLAAELRERLVNGPAEFRLLVQLAAASDDVLDGSKAWPDDRMTVDAGVIRLTRLVPDSETAQRNLLFTPLSLVAGIAPSGDPLLVARSRSYRPSFDRRRDDQDRKPAAAAPNGPGQ
ncbi:catalase family peroxidase [uncultured Enterovirga sp.]|uniref:catalase family peroxidase n=1 Tax=uncultured Enterovirga sp. TaxID=2026352 RepID=UPI0035C9E14F